MSAEHVLWQPEVSLNQGNFCVLSIYLSQKYPAALELPVEVISSNSEGDSTPTIEAKILFSNENVIDDLTRMVFLFHRRQIARNRTQS